MIQRLLRAGRLLEIGLDRTKDGGPGKRLGDYRLGDELGRGSTCIVYRATHVDGQEDVALKVMLHPEGATEEQLHSFRRGALNAAPLDHPHIVPVLDVGDQDGTPFFAMKLVQGGTLADWLNGPSPPSALIAAQLLAKVARAVHYFHCHERRVIHRDLKPANILIDERGEPYVTDFGLARRIDRRASVDDHEQVGYTVDYMSPEQAEGDVHKLTDIYSLGVIFYELLTGRVPYSGATPFAVVGQLADRRPVPPPRMYQPSIDRRFEDICLKCLDKDPQRRYKSAEALAKDLELVCADKRPQAHRSPRARAIASIRRNPRRSAAISGSALFVLLLAVLGVLDWRAQERERRQVLMSNAFIAGSQAGAALAQFRDYADRVAQLAREPVVRELLERGRITEPAPMLRPMATGFDSVFVMNKEGYIPAQWPSPAPEVFARTFVFRDYFRAAKRLAESGKTSVHVARAFQSESHRRLEFALSAPLLDSHGDFQGLIVATLKAKSVFGAVRMEVSDDDGQVTTALIGPRDNDRSSGPAFAPRSDLTFLVHPGLEAGAEYRLEAPSPAAFKAAFGQAGPPGDQLRFQYAAPLKVVDFQDPVPGFAGNWLAAFAPVAKTGFIVLVERRVEPSLLSRLLPSHLATPAGVALAFGLMLLLAAALGWLSLHVAAVVRRR